MSIMASQITSLTIGYATVHSAADKKNHQSSASLAFVPGIHCWQVNSPYKGPVTRIFFHLMTSSCIQTYIPCRRRGFYFCLVCVSLVQFKDALQWASCQIRKFVDAHAPGMPGTFSPSPQVSDPDMHHGTCVTHVPWCMSGSLTSGFLWNRRRGKTFPAFPAHAQPAIFRIW